MNNYKGTFISFEGGEGGGKTTQIKMLTDYLNNKNVDVLSAREPGGTLAGEAIRKVLLDPDIPKLPKTELFLYSAARTMFVYDIVVPALEHGCVIIADRYHDCTTAYQGYGGKINLEDVMLINKMATDSLNPDITFLLDLPAEIGLERAAKAKQEFGKKDWQESKKIDFHQRLRNGYLEIAKQNPDRFVVVDATKSIDACFEVITNYVDKFLEKKNR